MDPALISLPAGVMAVLTAVVCFWFWVEQKTQARIFNYLPPLPADSWKAFGSLAGSWVGGTGNMTAAHAALEGEASHMTMAAAADQLVYLVWLPILLGCKAFAQRFNVWMKVPPDRIAELIGAESAPQFIFNQTDFSQSRYL